MADNQHVQEAWNMATETLKRLSRCLDECTFFASQGDLIGWFNSSMNLRRNLLSFLEPNEQDILNKKLQELPGGWIRGGGVNPKNRIDARRILDEFYIICVGYMKAKGILMPKPTDPRAAVLNM